VRESSTHPAALRGSRRRIRPASVLVLVVAVLVLLAIIGTCFISTARIDRVAAGRYSVNTQADLLLDGTVALTEATLVGDLYRGSRFRPASGGSDAWTAAQSQPILASRVPVPISDVAPPWLASSSFAGASWPRTYFQGDYVSFDYRFWVCRKTHVAAPDNAPPDPDLWLDTGAADGNMPVWSSISRLAVGSDPRFQDLDVAGSPPVSTRTVLWPTSIQLNGRTVPALSFYSPASDQMETFPAADTDGDGIADALYSRVPTGMLNGVTYFVAVRVMDNNSAVNASVAWHPDDADPLGTCFPTHVNLLGLLRGGQPELDRLNLFRFGQASTTPPATQPSIDLAAARVDDLMALRTDFVFRSPQEALWMQLGRRLNNPWYATPNASGARFKALAGFDTGILAYKGGALLNTAVGPTGIETLLPDSTRATVANAPGGPIQGATSYSPDSAGVKSWFNTFDYLQETTDRATWKPRRALLTTRNPIAGVAPNRDMRPLLAPGEPAVVSTTGAPGLMPFYPANPPRVSINTATFGQLWRAFWAVMAEDWSGPRTPFSDYFQYRIQHDPPGTYDDPYFGMRFTAGTFAPIIATHPARMLRSPLRAVRPGAGSRGSVAEPPFDSATPRLAPDQVLLLRSALSAVNALDLRRNDDRVTAQDIPLNAIVGGASLPVTARVYGTKRQPFLSEIYAHTDTTTPSPLDASATNPNGYVAIAFHNPCAVPIDLLNCKLATIDRHARPLASRASGQGATAYPDLTVVDASVQTLPISFADARSNLMDFDVPALRPTVIPPGGTLVLENYDPRAPSDPDHDDRAALYRPAASGLPVGGAISSGMFPKGNFAFVPNLDLVLDREVVLLRPLDAQYIAETVHGVRYDGSSAATPMEVQFAGASRAVDMAPLDSFDFTGLPHPAERPSGVARAWHYARQTWNAAGPAWRFVYPGRYDANQPPLPGAARLPRQQGTQSVAWDPETGGDPWAANPPTPGFSLGAGATATYPSKFVVRLADAGWAGPSPLTAPTGNQYPFGGFARDGDILKVPFIGAYRVQMGSQLGSERVLEMNAVSMDSAFAQDTNSADDSTPGEFRREQIGRFVPTAQDLAATGECAVASATAATLCDPSRTEPPNTWAGFRVLITAGPGEGQERVIVFSDPASGTLTLASNWGMIPTVESRYMIRSGTYTWAARLFEYLGVLTTDGAWLPNTDPAAYQYRRPNETTFQVILPAPTPATLDTTPAAPRVAPPAIEGLVNVNTAPRKVLAAVPFFPTGSDTLDFRLDNENPELRGIPVQAPNGVSDNEELAQAIVAWRESNGPFRTLHDLFRVPGFLEATRLQVADTASTSGFVDFEAEHALLTRVSNLLTTRSDSFTCYAAVQGWLNYGTTAQELVVRRQRTFTVDRSGVTEASRVSKIQLFPSN